MPNLATPINDFLFFKYKASFWLLLFYVVYVHNTCTLKLNVKKGKRSKQECNQRYNFYSDEFGFVYEYV